MNKTLYDKLIQKYLKNEMDNDEIKVLLDSLLKDLNRLIGLLRRYELWKKK